MFLILVLVWLLFAHPVMEPWRRGGMVGRAETLAQRQALIDLYIATNQGTGWKSECKAGGWSTVPNSTMCNTSSSPYSTYHGLTCSQKDGEITQLNKFNCSLKGTLPPSLAALSSLNSLYLYANQLTGTLPPEWSRLSALQVLWFAQQSIVRYVTASMEQSYGTVAGIFVRQQFLWKRCQRNGLKGCDR